MPHALSLTIPAILFGSLACAQGTNVDWTPTGRRVELDTDSATLQTSIGRVTVKDGKFVFRNVTIPAGTTVVGTGSRPLVLVIAGTLRVNGTLSVRGGDGAPGIFSGFGGRFGMRVPELGTLGGAGHCGGGLGGQGSPNSKDRSFFGGSGGGPFGFPGFGGRGGLISCANSSCGIGSAGGGGSFATVGDPWFHVPPAIYFVQPTGRGGYGCRTRWSTALPGGAAGRRYFVDSDASNDFFGFGVDVNRRRLIRGELPSLVGGSGGGAGGDYATSCATQSLNWANDECGGAGGGGGGVVCILASGPIILGAQGRIDASGGNGGGGSWWGSSNRAGGGGGGAGGLAILYSRTRIDIEVHGETYAKFDYDFPVSADGGVGLLATYGGGGRVRHKYDGMTQTNMNARPSGGLGGLGIIQFMTPPGTRNLDGTNTHLDDNVVLRKNGVALRGAEKIRYLAWRGFPDAQGKWVDDFGKVTKIGKDAGDFRPTPILLPAY